MLEILTFRSLTSTKTAHFPSLQLARWWEDERPSLSAGKSADRPDSMSAVARGVNPISSPKIRAFGGPPGSCTRLWPTNKRRCAQILTTSSSSKPATPRLALRTTHGGRSKRLVIQISLSFPVERCPASRLVEVSANQSVLSSLVLLTALCTLCAV